ncbi:hypothetical protein Tco_0003775 [Tanacetum coccineum]
MNLSPKQTEVRQVIFENKLSVCAILESHVADQNLDRLCKHVFNHWNWVSNAMSCSKGTRIIVGWNQYDVDVTVIHQDSQVIHTRVWIKADRKELFCSFVYAHNHYIQRRPLWNGLCLHKNYINNRPWCLLGDFNASLYVDDTSIGSSTLDITMREFKDCVETMEVMDVQRTGLHFTWNQKPKGKDGILRKLDRVLANLEFQDCFLGAHAIFKPYRISDHSPSVLSIPSIGKVKPKPFKFFNVVILDKRFKDVVRDGWLAQVSGFHMFRVVKKLKGLKKPIRKLMYDKGNLHANVVRLREDLDKVQTALDSDPSNVSIREKEAAAVVAFNDALLMEEKLNDIEALNMVHDISSQEVKSAMFSMGSDKSPGPDGFTAAFFKDTWEIIGSDVTKAICEFFTNGRLLKELNHTIIALIPKVNAPARVNDYRPISCCNMLFKCISKIIANRLKDSLKRLVSPNQSAFVPGRCISDNILLIQEIMHNYHLDCGAPRCAFKVDIQKAYDTVDWEFLRVALIGFGFHDRMISWIMEYVTTTSFSISINGSLHDLELINLCFADDLFLFAHGDVHSARVIKEALVEFKDAPGLNPSMLKSKAYFCKVINYTKLAILNVLPFEEERLPVKYLGVLLVSSRLIFRDCKELIEKVQNRVNDWKNNMSRGKAKVAWDVVCLPKQEGGLGVRRLDHFNKALMVSHVWKILSLKWCAASPLYNIISSRDIARAGFSRASKVRECIHDGVWSWPNEWLVKYPILNSIPAPILNDDKSDYLEWRSRDGSVNPFSVHHVWDSIRPRDNLVSWYDLVWSRVKHLAGLMGSGSSLDSIVLILLPIAKRKSSKSCIGKLVVATAAYFVWQECNSRLFKNAKRYVKEVVDCIMSFVRLKLLSCHFKKSKDAMLFARLWELPVSTLK